MSDFVEIEDDDGFITRWPIGEGVSMLHLASTIDAFQEAHDEARVKWEKERQIQGDTPT